MRALALLLPLPLVFAACGANGPAPKTIQPAASADGGATTVALTVSSALPEAKLPPPLRLNSKRVARKPMPAWAGCAAASKPVGDAAKSLDALTNVCAAGSKVRPGSPISGSGNATTPAASSRFHAEAGRCYRVYGAASAGVKGFIVTIMDADGANVAEYHADSVSPFIAPDEALCAEKAEDLTVLVAVGAGDGGYAVSIGAEP